MGREKQSVEEGEERERERGRGRGGRGGGGSDVTEKGGKDRRDI